MNTPYTCGSVTIEFDSLPSLIPELLKTTGIGGFAPWQALRGASAKRYFHLERDWQVAITIDKAEYDEQDLSGIVVIPRVNPESKAQTRFDGASVPLPWLVSFLSFGVLRPLGVMLTASIVHDFAFEYGYLYYRKEDGLMAPLELRRDLADQLFYDMIKTVNNMPLTAYIGWLAVRLGWFFVKYNKQPRGGKPPYIAVCILFLLLLVLEVLIIVFGLTTVFLGLSTLYIFIFVLLQLTAHSIQKELTE